MKKFFSTLLGLACVALMTVCLSCGNSGSGKSGAGNDNAGAAPSTKAASSKNDNVTPEQMKEKGFALKYDLFSQSKRNNVAIFTRKGSSTRLDIFSTDDEGNPTDEHSVYIETKDADGKYTGYGWSGDEDEAAWTDDDVRARQTANNAFSMIYDMSKHFLEHGYEAKGTTTICGRTCNVYEGTYNRGKSILAVYDELGRDGMHGSFAAWNGFALRAKCDIWGYDEATDQRIVTGEYTTFECTAIQIGVPDDAFTKTLKVSWIK